MHSASNCPMFQHTAARRRLQYFKMSITPRIWFQHTAARRRLPSLRRCSSAERGVSTHSRPKAAASTSSARVTVSVVSTHSRPKAAAFHIYPLSKHAASFNTQPPEGGCSKFIRYDCTIFEFQHTAARRRLPLNVSPTLNGNFVSTHSRPKAAAFRFVFLV